MRNKVLMIYPYFEGLTSTFVAHTPISLIYASIELVKNNVDVEIFDARLFPFSWKNKLKEKLSGHILIVGISVMTGQPIKSAIEIGRYVKEIDSKISIVWGGPHATLAPETCFQEQSVDYVISGYAVKSFGEFVRRMLNNESLEGVPGLYYRLNREDINSEIIKHAPLKQFEFVDFHEIPYDLITDYSVYGQLEHKGIIFSMYSVMGCPYKCTFCMSPAKYREYSRSWIPLEISAVADHIEYVVNKYGATYIYFIDDDSFINLNNVEELIDEMNRRRIKVGLGFRGARINEIKRMSYEFLDKLSHVGTDIMHIGAESGSNRILNMIKKNCSVDDILVCNKKLSKTRIKAGYNFIVGLPSETIEELKATKRLMLQLVKDNKECLIFNPSKYRPIPGTEMYDISIRDYGYMPLNTLNEYIGFAVDEENFIGPWYTQEMKSYIRMLIFCSFFIDGKIFKLTSGKTLFYRLLRLAGRLYTPIAKLRMKHDITAFLIEYWVYKIGLHFINRFLILRTRDGVKYD